MGRSSISESSITPTSSEEFEHLSSNTLRAQTPAIPSSSTRIIPTATTRRTMSRSTHTGVYYLPVPGSKNAPKKFKGKFSEIKLFVKHYEKLCVQKQVLDPQEKIENITQYCSKKVREFMEGLPSYSKGNWDLFVQDLLEFYDADRDIKRYKRGDLEAFCKSMRHWKTSMRLSHWKQFNRDFIRIAGWLETHQKISTEENAIYYWKGIPQEFRNKLEARLLAINPDHDLEQPFEVDQVNKVAKSFLQRNRFDSERIFSDNESDESESEDSGTDSDSDSDSETESKKTILKFRKRKEDQKKSKAKTKKTVEFKEPVEETPKKINPKPKPPVKTKSDEVEDLIQQMNRMSINDPTYSVLYYRAYNLDPVIGDIMMKPVARQQLSRQITNNRINEIRANATMAQNNVLRQNPPPPVNREIPPHLNPGANVFQQSGPPRTDERKCFGCGKTGHTIYVCAEIESLLTRRIIARGPTGRITMADGTPIRKMAFDEPLVPAIERMMPVQTNFVTFKEVSKVENNSDESDDEPEEEEVFIATRAMKKNTRPIAERTRNQFKRVETTHPRLVEKENIPPEDDARTGNLPVPNIPTPFSVDKSIFRGDDEDEFMEDSSAPQKPAEQQVIVQKRPPRRSEVQSQVNQMTILGRILSQPVTLAVGEVFGISKEMTASLKEVLKSKNNTPDIPESAPKNNSNLIQKEKSKPVLSATSVTRAKEMLIKLRMECDGKPITAIIDTGSQLNIAHSDIWKSILQRPIDTKDTVIMNDAGGGETRLNGLVANVPLSCGSVLTHANIYIGDNVKFDLLLGRPWQRGNFITIDEREDGTYLLFKDRNLDVRHEILVTPDDILVQDPYSHEYYSQTKRSALVNSVTVDPDPSKEIPMEVDNEESSVKPTQSKGERSPDKPIAQDPEILEDEPPGLINPKTILDFQKLMELWSQNSHRDLTQTDPEILDENHKKKYRSPNWPLDEDDWKLIQILTKQDTRDWRRQNTRILQKVSRRRKKIPELRISRNKALIRLALQNSNIRRLWDLTKKLELVTSALADQVTDFDEPEHYPNYEAFSSNEDEDTGPEKEWSDADEEQDQVTRISESEKTQLEPQGNIATNHKKTPEISTALMDSANSIGTNITSREDQEFQMMKTNQDSTEIGIEEERTLQGRPKNRNPNQECTGSMTKASDDYSRMAELTIGRLENIAEEENGDAIMLFDPF